MSPLIIVQSVLIVIGVALLVISWGMWVAWRKYPKPEYPFDNVETFTMGCFALAGVLFVLTGGAL